MSLLKRGLSLIVAITIICVSTIGANAFLFDVIFPRNLIPEITYEVPEDMNKNMKKVYNNYNFSIAWGLYDISGSTLKNVASYNVDKLFQSNCTIKAAMLMYMCKLMDKGELSLKTKMYVNKSKLHYSDFSSKSGNYTVEYLLTKMINVSNNVCYEVFLRYVTKENFNKFLKDLGSGTVIGSYNFMGNCKPSDRAIEWFNIYKYCHSNKEHSSFAWQLFVDAKFSPIRDGLERDVAHKSGWYYKKGTSGTAGDCAIVKSDNGGCYLLVIFTKNNNRGNYSQALIRDLSKNIDPIWDDYYSKLIYPKSATF